MKMKNYLLIICFIFLLINVVNAQNIDQARQQRIDFGYVLSVKDISTEPGYLIPGSPGKLKIVFENQADFPLYDLRVEVNLSDQILFLNDISTKKIHTLKAGETVEIVYDIIALRDTEEGVYDSELSFVYLNHVGTERQENNNFGLAVKAVPKIFAQIEETELTTRNSMGITTIRFVNNNVGDIKFLTVELLESADYDILSPSIEYIGDLDSDDFDSVDFKLRLTTNEDQINLPVMVNYKDALNEEYSQELDLDLDLRNTQATNQNKLLGWQTILIVIIVIIGVFYFYRRHKIKKSRHLRH